MVIFLRIWKKVKIISEINSDKKLLRTQKKNELENGR